jgi:hypothetical protein
MHQYCAYTLFVLYSHYASCSLNIIMFSIRVHLQIHTFDVSDDGRVGRMRCQISESRISAFLKSPGHAENCLQKTKTKFSI